MQLLVHFAGGKLINVSLCFICSHLYSIGTIREGGREGGKGWFLPEKYQNPSHPRFRVPSHLHTFRCNTVHYTNVTLKLIFSILKFIPLASSSTNVPVCVKINELLELFKLNYFTAVKRFSLVVSILR